ncbi:MAG TPA: transglycosylase SLT domain-containing protein, partial [Tepiditoga sp.]|nr:transglycosylase SLT domain-containing protein [Tepiditoga sp.]
MNRNTSKLFVLIFIFIILCTVSFSDNTDPQSEIKTRTFLTDFISNQYRITTGSDLSVSRLYDIVDAIILSADTFGVSPLLIAAIIDTETNFRNIIGPLGELGYMQVRPGTAAYVVEKYKSNFETLGYGNSDKSWIEKRLLTDTNYNILIGTAYVKYLMGNYSDDIYKAIGWYNG